MRVLLIASCALLLSAAAPPRAAEACYNEVEATLDQETSKVERAERLLSRGRAAPALRVAGAALRDLDRDAGRRGRAAPHSPDPGALRRRAVFLVAVATVRLDGAVSADHTRPLPRATADERSAALAWARSELETRHAEARRADSWERPVAAARYAEALARTPADRRAARELLEGLAAADLMPDAWAFRTLSELRHDAGERAGRDEAATRCRDLAGRAARQVCPRFELGAARGREAS